MEAILPTPFYTRKPKANMTCLHVNLADAARSKYPAALLPSNFDTP